MADVRSPALDERSVEWLDWRCRALRQNIVDSRGVAVLRWSRSLRAAVEESRARNVPLVIAMLGWGDDLPPLFQDRATVDLLNESFVLLLAQKDEDEDKKPHEQLVVEGESRCARQPTITCEQHDDARKDLKDGDRELAHFPRDRIESKGEDYRFLVQEPGRLTLVGFSDEPSKSKLEQYTAHAMATALASARAATGRPRLELDDLADIVRADALAAGGDAKRAIASLQKASRSPHALVRDFARHRLEVDLLARCDAAIDAARALSRDKAKTALRALKREYGELPACLERVNAALDLLGR